MYVQKLFKNRPGEIYGETNFSLLLKYQVLLWGLPAAL
jgi:hypothetical protein